MAERPTTEWTRLRHDEAEEYAEGTIEEDDLVYLLSFPDELIEATEEVLSTFEDAVQAVDPTDDDAIMAAVRDVVLALNTVNVDLARDDVPPFETEEREQLCEYIDTVLIETRIDVEGLTGRRGIGRWELTDEWRQW